MDWRRGAFCNRFSGRFGLGSTARMASSTITLKPGDVLAGRYQIEVPIGAGGFGTVFRAMQLNLNRTVALKVLLPELVDQPSEMERFRREAQLAQKLEHPNTVRLFDFGVSENGVPFMAWELLKGKPLDALIRSERGLSPARVYRITSQVLKSLMEAHALGIVHRDIKPSNIFICDFQGEPDYVKVLDFGIAKAVQSKTQVGLTQAGIALGTPSYMAPEQVAGGAITPGSDLYALGLVMGEALSGHTVMKGSTGMEIAIAQASPSPVPLPPEATNSPLGPVIHKATQKSQALRYGSAREMLEHLEAVMRPSGPQPVAQQGPPVYGSAPAPAGAGFYGGGSPAMGYASAPVPYQNTPNTVSGAMPQMPGPSHPQPTYPQNPQTSHGFSSFQQAPSSSYQAPVGNSGAKTGLIVLMALVGLLFIAGGVGAFLMMRDPEPSGSAGVSGGAGISGPAGRLGEMTDQDLRSRIKSAGWAITGETLSNQMGFSMMSFTLSNLPKVASVNLYRYQDGYTASILENSLKQNGQGAVLRDDKTILFVMVIPQDLAGSQALLKSLAR